MSDRIEFANLTEAEVTEDNPEGLPKRPGSIGGQGTSYPPVRRAEASTPLTERAAQRAEGLQTIIIGLCIFAGGVTIALIFQLAAGQPELKPHGAAASCDDRCSSVAVDMMKQGGSAVDGAVAAALCIAVVHPQMAGLGGGGLMFIHDHKNHQNALLDFLESKPQTEESPVGIPGFLRGMWDAHRRFGKLRWSKLFEPAIELARYGFVVTKDLDADYQPAAQESGDGNFADYFAGLEIGETFENGKLAETLELIAENGIEEFYSDGTVAASIASETPISLDELSYYEVRIPPSPASVHVRGYTVASFPAPSAGALLVRSVSKLNDTEHADLGEMLKSAYLCRSRINAPGFEDAVISNSSFRLPMKDCYAKKPLVDTESSASHVSIIDQDDMVVSMGLSLGSKFGSKIVTSTGIVMNDRAKQSRDEDQENDHSFSPLIPTVVYSNKRPCLKRFAIGAAKNAGSDSISAFDAVVQIVRKLIILDQHLEDAIESPRVTCDNQQEGEKNCYTEQEGGPRHANVAIAYKKKNKVTARADKGWGAKTF